MISNMPEVVAYRHVNKEHPTLRGVSLLQDPSCYNELVKVEPLIRLSDYEALQSECERLREALFEAQATMASALSFEPAINEVTKMTLRAEIERIKSLLSEGGNKS